MKNRETLIRTRAFYILHSLFFAFLLGCDQAPLLNKGSKVEVEVKPGSSALAVATELRSAGVIDNELEFRYLCWVNNWESRIRPGRYRFVPGSGEKAVLEVLIGKGATARMVTLPEGLTLQEAAGVLDRNEVCDSAAFVAACTDTAVLRRAGIRPPSAEGFLFPETYEFLTGTEPGDVVERLARQFWTVYDELDSAAGPERQSAQRAVILASIVEREARVPAERPVIAGVFANRLRRRIPLQSCATVEYILQQRKPVLSVEDTRIQSPYNTYLHAGLPPGPICSPGRAALEAALNPARHDYIFFVSNGDGTHTFSRTQAEHESAVRRSRQGT